jgi:hypothetical protein
MPWAALSRSTSSLHEAPEHEFRASQVPGRLAPVRVCGSPQRACPNRMGAMRLFSQDTKVQALKGAPLFEGLSRKELVQQRGEADDDGGPGERPGAANGHGDLRRAVRDIAVVTTLRPHRSVPAPGLQAASRRDGATRRPRSAVSRALLASGPAAVRASVAGSMVPPSVAGALSGLPYHIRLGEGYQDL